MTVNFKRTVSLVLTMFFGLTIVFGQTEKNEDIPPPPPSPSSTVIETVPIKTKEFKSSLYKVQFNYPINWTEVSLNDGSEITLGGLDSKKDSFPDMLSLRVKYIGITLSAEEKRQALENIQKEVSNSGVKLVKNIKYTFDNTDFMEQTFRGKMGDIYGQYKSVLCIKDGFLYMFLFLYNPTRQEEKEHLCKTIISSIKFTK